MEHSDRLSDFTTDPRVIVLSLLAAVIGCFSAFVAWALVWLIALFTNLSYFHRLSAAPASPQHAHLGWTAALVPIVGGLVIGLMARYGSPKIRGHGIPEALEAILIGRSKLDPKVAVLKPLSSAISIGTGGPFGAEGPIIMTGGAFGSIVAQFFKLSSAERKTLLVAGAAAGMAAIFSAPVAAVLLAVELLLFEWKPRSFIPVAIASVAAAVMRVPLLGAGAVFPIVPHAPLSGATVLCALLVGLAAGVGSGALTNLVYAFEDAFQKLPIHWAWWPAIGGAFIGIGGLIDPRVLGVGYETIHSLLRGDLIGMTVLGLLISKSLVWSISLGSGTSGGVLAPLLMMGGALGALEAHWLPVNSPGLWAAVSMAAMMGGTMRAPFTAMIFTLELTHDLNLLPALLVASVASMVVTVLCLRRSILTEKVARRGHHLVREYTADPLDIHRVGEVMLTQAPEVSAALPLKEFAAKISHGTGRIAKHHAAVVKDEQGRLVGVITRGDVLRAVEEEEVEGRLVRDACSREVVTIHEDDTVRDAVVMMLRHDVGRLPVVKRENLREVVGYVDRARLMQVRARWYEEEHVRERTWPLPRPVRRTVTGIRRRFMRV